MTGYDHYDPRRLVWEELETARVDKSIGVEQLAGTDIKATRARVVGGWLVFVTYLLPHPPNEFWERIGRKPPDWPPTFGTGLTFVPDPKHEWDGTSPDFDRYIEIRNALRRALDRKPTE
jgi:hypothetical protein